MATLLYALLQLQLALAVALMAFWGVASIMAKWRAARFRRLNRNMPVYSQWISWGNILARAGLIPTWLMRFPPGWDWEAKFQPFEKSEHGAIAICLPLSTFVFIADAALAREATSKFPKPLHFYGILDVFGRNVVTTEGEEWKRHRRISAPQFSESNNRLVHATTVATASEMFLTWERNASSKADEKGPSCVVDPGHDMTKFALMVVSGAGFGLPLDWAEENTKTFSKGHRLAYRKSLELVVEYLTFYLVAPRFLYKLPIKKLKVIDNAFDEFRSYMQEFIVEARSKRVEGEGKRNNLLSSLVAGAYEDTNGGRGGLTESELMGNMFVFLFAGHETTAGTLEYALTLLALHQDHQQRLHEDVRKVLGDRTFPLYSDFPKLAYCMAVMNEVLRMYPPVVEIPKWTAETDMTLGPYVLPARTYIEVMTPALHNNPKFWGQDTKVFRPERFLAPVVSMGDPVKPRYERYAFLPFSEGGRACLGRKFSQVEFVCLLAMISRRYKWRLADESMGKEDVLASHCIITLRPRKSIQLAFTPRPDCGTIPTKEQAETSGSS